MFRPIRCAHFKGSDKYSPVELWSSRLSPLPKPQHIIYKPAWQTYHHPLPIIDKHHHQPPPRYGFLPNINQHSALCENSKTNFYWNNGVSKVPSYMLLSFIAANIPTSHQSRPRGPIMLTMQRPTWKGHQRSQVVYHNRERLSVMTCRVRRLMLLLTWEISTRSTIKEPSAAYQK